MAFCLTIDESAAEGVRRIVREQVERAIEEIDEAEDPSVAIHEVRKCCKKIRGTLRLGRELFGSRRVRRENARFRDIARSLSGLRDATARLEGLGALEGAAPAAALDALRTRLLAERVALDRTLDADERLANAHEVLVEARGRVDRWDLESGGAAVVRGAARVYRLGRRAMCATLDERAPRDECFHAWRKQCKYLGYHVRVLHPVRPSALDDLRADLEQLGELLGTHHDLVGLRSHLRTFDHLDPAPVVAAIDRRRDEIAATCHDLGAGIYQDRAKVWRRRLRRWWRAWRASRH